MHCECSCVVQVMDASQEQEVKITIQPLPKPKRCYKAHQLLLIFFLLFFVVGRFETKAFSDSLAAAPCIQIEV